MTRILLAVCSIAVFANALANDVVMRGEYAWAPHKLSVNAPPPLLESLKNSSAGPIFSIQEASLSAPGKLADIKAWNRGNGVKKNGFSHNFPSATRIEISPSTASPESANRKTDQIPYGQIMQTAGGDVMWSATIEVENSYRLRLNLTDVQLPKNARLWVTNEADEVVGPFSLELSDANANMWTPSVAGPVIRLVVMLPEGSPVGSFNLVRVAEIFKLGPSGEPVLQPEADAPPSCLVQSLCVDVDTFPRIIDVEKAIGRMDFMTNGESFNCTGGLVNDSVAETTIPYFLSANHCFTTQEVASTLEVFWDWKADVCDGTAPDLGSVPRSSGATLKATGEPADFLLLELNAIPAGRFFLGWDLTEAAIAPGSVLHRVHNPGGDLQSYEQSRVDPGPQSCGPDWTTDTHIWGKSLIGTTIGGSSGSPILTAEGNVVGQLSGTCGEFEQCSADEPVIDGKVISYWTQIAPFISPSNNSGSSDLSLVSLDAANGSYAPGGSFNVTSRIDNVGNAVSPAFRITIYASIDSSITSGDIVLAFSDRPALAAGASDQVNGEVTLPSNMAAGNYYIGAILTPTDSNPGNNTRFDSTRITVTGGTVSSFQVNAGLSGSWYDPGMNGQGFLLEVLPTSKLVFVAWFTFDATRPTGSDNSTIGAHGQRWMTALGNYSSNQMELPVYNASGGVFASGTPAVSQEQIGTITVTFISCTEATIAFSIPGVPNGTINVQRLAADNVALCNSLAQQAAQAD